MQRSLFITFDLYSVFVQISDLDVSRCREGRLDYLGSASFILIAGLMSCLMVNESMGDAFIDAALPSFFSSIYVLANTLYNISFFAILFPSIAVVGIFLYYTFVYQGAVKSHKDRKALLRLRKWNSDFGREEKPLRQNTRRSRDVAYGVGEFIRRFFMLLHYRMVTLIMHVSDKRLKKRVAVENSFTHKWCAMNKPALHQGTMLLNSVKDSVSVISFEGDFNAEDDTNNGHYFARRLSIYRNPPEIARMVKASHMWWTAHDSQSHSISDSLAHQSSIIFRPDYPLSRKSHQVLRATIIFDTGEALLRISSNLFITAIHEKGSDYDWNVELFKVSASALLEELQNIFDAFYPDGIPMSKLEKREACEQFSNWIQGHDSSQSSDGVCLDSQMIPFKEFHDWFYDLSAMIHDLASDRLFAHLLLLTRRSNAASADAVRLLNVVAPNRSNTIYRPYQSARQPPVSLTVPSIPPHLHYYSDYDSIPDVRSNCCLFFGSPQPPRQLLNFSDCDSIPDAQDHTDDDDLCSTDSQDSERKVPLLNLSSECILNLILQEARAI